MVSLKIAMKRKNQRKIKEEVLEDFLRKMPWQVTEKKILRFLQNKLQELQNNVDTVEISQRYLWKFFQVFFRKYLDFNQQILLNFQLV